MHLWPYRHHTAHTRTSTGSGGGRTAELDPVAVPQSRCTYAPSTGAGSGGRLNLTGECTTILSHTPRTSTGSGCGGTAELAPVAVPPSCRTHAHFDWLWVRRHTQLVPGDATPPCSIKFGMSIYLLLVLLADFHTADFSAYSLWKLVHKFYKAGNLVGGKI